MSGRKQRTVWRIDYPGASLKTNDLLTEGSRSPMEIGDGSGYLCDAPEAGTR
jgi:hypothetical protein